MNRSMLLLFLLPSVLMEAFAAEWHSDFHEVGATDESPAPPPASFSLTADDRSVTCVVRAERATADDRLELFLSPDGTASEYYRFAVGPSAADAAAWYYAEGGNIQPDPYGPVWSNSVGVAEGVLTAELRIPLSAFYMTRNVNWKETWRVNVVRRREGQSAFLSWSPLAASPHEPSAFRTLGGFPLRAEVEDVCMSSVVAEMKGPSGGSVVGVLQFRISAGLAGDYELSSPYGTEVKTLALTRGDNVASLACAYPDRGTYPTRLTLKHKSSGRVMARDWPVIVDYQPVSVRFTRPQYRTNFYPGQDASVVSGTLSLALGGTATVTLSGPGFAPQEATVADGGTFAFDTTGFAVGEATLTVTSGSDVLTRKVRRLAPSPHRMTWIENGVLYVDGQPCFRRNMYAKDYMIGDCMKARYAAEGDAFPMTTEMGAVELSPNRLISDIEAREATRDVRPCQELFDKIDAAMAANADRDFGCYYICDEPECRSISPVYLKYIYDYVAEKDPYHVIDMATRGGLTYLDCADLLETHPYLNPYRVGDQRRYGRQPYELGTYVDAFEPAAHPDKCIGSLPTCFAAEEYPTLDEYLFNVWVMLAHGARTLWPYADHDIGDRAQLWEGTRYAFTSAGALQNFLLLGTRTMLVNTATLQGSVFEYGGERLVVLCNCTSEAKSADLAGVGGTFREFRGTRLFDLSAGPVSLGPLESLVLVTGTPDAGLSSLAELRATVAAAEAERLGRDNQLLGRTDDIIVTHNLDGMKNAKLFDGCREVICKYKQWQSNNFVEMAFDGFVASFRKVRVFGEGLDALQVKIRKGGEWIALEPVATVTDTWMRELDFGVTNTTVKMRLEFPGVSGKKNYLEIYEIELPRAGESGGGGETVKPIEDRGVVTKWDADDCPITTANYSTEAWYTGDDKMPPMVVTDTGFMVSNMVTRHLSPSQSAKWAVIDVERFAKIPLQSYFSWSVYFLYGQHFCGTVTYPQPGIYTIPMDPMQKGDFLRLDIRGLEAYFNSITFVDEPGNRVELSAVGDPDDIRPGERIVVEVHFAVPCEDVAAEFLLSKDSGGLHPFAVNGSSGIELKATDETLTVWRTEIDVRSCSAAGARTVYVKAVPLGGAANRAVFSNFRIPFRSAAVADVVVTEPGAQAFAAPDRFLMLSNAVANADVVFDRSAEEVLASRALKFTGFDAVAHATTRFRGGWWDFLGLNGFFRADSANGGRLTEISSGALVTNAGPVEVAGPSGDGNALVLKDASSLYADSLVLGRKSSGGQRSRVSVLGGSHLSVAGDVSMSECPIWKNKLLSGNTLVVSNAGSRLTVGGTTFVARQYSKAEGGDGYYGSIGGNALVVTDGAEAHLRQLVIDNACRRGVSNRVEVSHGAYLETTGIGLSSGWSSIYEPGDYNRLDILDGSVVSNRGAFLMGQYQTDNHRKSFVVVSNSTFVTTTSINASHGLFQAAESEIVISGANAQFKVGSYGDSTPLFAACAHDCRFVVEDGACIELPIEYGYGYTHETTRDAVIFRNGGRYAGGDVCMAGYANGGQPGWSNSFVVASGSVVTTGLFRANSRGGLVSVDDATLVSTYADAGTAAHALWIGFPGDGYRSAGADMTLEMRGRRPRVVAANGRIRFDSSSVLRIVLPPEGYAADALPLVTAARDVTFDALTGCGLEILGADDFLEARRRAHVRQADYALVEAQSIDIPSEALAAADAGLPRGLALVIEARPNGRQALVLRMDTLPAAGGAEWTAYMMGLVTAEDLETVRAAVAGKSTVTIAIVSSATSGASGPDELDDFMESEMRQLAGFLGLSVEVVRIPPQEAGSAYEKAVAAGDIIVDFRSCWDAATLSRVKQVIAAYPGKLFILPYGEIGGTDGSGLANLVTTIPLAHGYGGRLTRPARRTEQDTSTVSFVVPSAWASDPDETCSSAAAASVAAACVYAAQDGSPTAAEIVHLLARGAGLPVPSAAMEFDEAALGTLKSELAEMTAKDEFGRAMLLHGDVVSIKGALDRLAFERGRIHARDSFEDHAAGTRASSIEGWTGSALVAAADYEPATPPGFPLPDESHTKVLDAGDDDAVRMLPERGGADGRIDVMMRMARARDGLPQPEEDELFRVSCDSDGRLCLWHLYEEDGVWKKGWIPLSEQAYGNGEWVRVGAELDYASSPTGDAFVKVTVNGSAQPTAHGVRSPTDTRTYGAWHYLAKNRRSGGVARPTELQVVGTMVDDLLLCERDIEPEHTGAKSIDGIEFSWFDEAELPRDPRFAAPCVPGYTLGDLHTAGLDPYSERPLELTDFWFGADGTPHLEFNGYRGDIPVGYRILYSATPDFRDAAALGPEDGSFTGDAATRTTTWDGKPVAPDGAGFYKVEAVQ